MKLQNQLIFELDQGANICNYSHYNIHSLKLTTLINQKSLSLGNS